MVVRRVGRRVEWLARGQVSRLIGWWEFNGLGIGCMTSVHPTFSFLPSFQHPISPSKPFLLHHHPFIPSSSSSKPTHHPHQLATSWELASSPTPAASPVLPSTPLRRCRSWVRRRRSSEPLRPRATPPSTGTSSSPPSSAGQAPRTRVASQGTSLTSAPLPLASTASLVSAASDHVSF